MNLGTNFGIWNTNVPQEQTALTDAQKSQMIESLPELDPRRQRLEVETEVDAGKSDDANKKPGYKSSPEDCETCKNRKYQDGSDECNVSFKSASHIAPQAAGAAVRAHENMHVQNAYAEATEKGGRVINASVSIKTCTCPECGRSYVAGGLTRTMIAYPNEDNPYQKDRKAQHAIGLTGAGFDMET